MDDPQPGDATPGESRDEEPSASRDEELEAMRAEIDEIDLAVLELVSKRFVVTNRVGHYKVAHGIAASDPEREATQIARAREMAAAAGVNPDLAENVLRLVIDEVVRCHHEIARELTGGADDPEAAGS